MLAENMYRHKSSISSLVNNIEKVIVGKRSTVELVITSLLAKGHVLIEDIPGVGKTMLVNSLAKSSGLTFSRIQCTPDMLPSDITGFNLYDINTGKGKFTPGPLMSQLVLADEINRTSPKTQSSFLEAMEEYQVSIDGVSHPLPQPFMVLATQNPIECVGTYPLPEAQMDRFLMRISLGYPNPAQEFTMLERFMASNPLDSLQPVLRAQDIIELQDAAMEVHVSDSVKGYILNIINATRNHKDLALGASPRASIALLKAAQAYALIQGGAYVTPEDVQALAEPVLAHRLILNVEAKINGRTQKQIINEIVSRIKVPLE